MKIQDAIFLFVLLIMLFSSIKNPNRFVYAGTTCFVVSIPLFYFWIFFTAQRLVYYGLAFFLIAALILLYFLWKSRYNK